MSRRNTEVKPIPGGKRNETEGKLQGLQGRKLEEVKRKARENQDAWSFGKDRRYG